MFNVASAEKKRSALWAPGYLLVPSLWRFLSLQALTSFPPFPLSQPFFWKVPAVPDPMLTCVSLQINTSSKTSQSPYCLAARPHISVRLTGCVAKCVLRHCTLCVSECVFMICGMEGWVQRQNERDSESMGTALLLLSLHN